jgi:hypothetical protein
LVIGFGLQAVLLFVDSSRIETSAQGVVAGLLALAVFALGVVLWKTVVPAIDWRFRARLEEAK